ncbi:MAG: hypothetical protein ABI488_21590 [Polyangiaceae bacterium]
MSSTRLGWVARAALLAATAWSPACRHDNAPPHKRDPAVLDGMELAAARRVGLDSAVDALERGDLKRLKMLRVWAQKRAQVVLFPADDMASLDVAIACADGSLAVNDRAPALAKLKSGRLLEPTRALCLEPTD